MDAKPRFVLDPLGIFYLTLCCSWTAVLAAGMVFLWRRRDEPLVRVRGLRVVFCSIIFLHTYWMSIQFANIVKPFPIIAEYWIMGVYLPFGIALFHASNGRFLYVASHQRRFAHGGEEPKIFDYKQMAGGRVKWRQGHTAKIVIFVSIGLVVQVGGQEAPFSLRP